MQFSTLTLSALSIGSALAASSTSSAASSTSTGAIKVHVVRVGSANGSLAYFPNNLTAAVGDMVQFQFAPANHTVTQSTFDQPCQPISMNSATVGIYSGFMPVTAASTTTPTYTIMVNSTTPMWLYCSQGKHCQAGMTMVINENVAANASRSLAAFQSLAAKATVNLPGTAVSGGSSSSSTASNGSSTSTSTSASGTTSTTSSAGTKSTTASGASSIKIGSGLGLSAVLAVVMGLVL